ncbi:MAG TPA: prolyl oligopeptidase family serine peptidase, partial [Byssovorax sp.]
DPRVASWQSRKFAARLQAAGGSAPVLLLTRDTGHGIGNPLEMQIANEADLYGFIFRHLGVD